MVFHEVHVGGGTRASLRAEATHARRVGAGEKHHVLAAGAALAVIGSLLPRCRAGRMSTRTGMFAIAAIP
jgi:hypothetical protein